MSGFNPISPMGLVLEGFLRGSAARDEMDRQKRLDERQARMDQVSTLSKLAEYLQSGGSPGIAKQMWQGMGYDPMTTTVTETKQVPIQQKNELGGAFSPINADLSPVLGKLSSTRQADLFDTIKPQRTVSRAIDLGDRVVVYYSDGSSETQAKAAKAQRPLVLPQGTVAVNPQTGQPIASGAPKTFAPRATPQPRQQRLVTNEQGERVVDAPGVKVPTKRPSSSKPKTDAELMREAEFEAGPKPDAMEAVTNPAAVQQWHQKRMQLWTAKKRQRDQAQVAHGGGGQAAPALSPTQQAIIDALKGK